MLAALGTTSADHFQAREWLKSAGYGDLEAYERSHNGRAIYLTVYS
jgi:hypothetical protein